MQGARVQLWLFSALLIRLRLPRWLSGREFTCQCRSYRRHGFDRWIGNIPWRRARQPTVVFLPGKAPWTEEPGGLQSMGLQRIGHDWARTHQGLLCSRHCPRCCLSWSSQQPDEEGTGITHILQRRKLKLGELKWPAQKAPLLLKGNSCNRSAAKVLWSLFLTCKSFVGLLSRGLPCSDSATQTPSILWLCHLLRPGRVSSPAGGWGRESWGLRFAWDVFYEADLEVTTITSTSRLFWLQLPAEEPGKCSPVACPGRKGFGDHTVVSATGTQEANNRASQTLHQLFLCLPKHMLLLGSGSVSAGDLTPSSSRLGEFSLTRAAVLALNSANAFWLASPEHLLT